ncbi:MAG: copper resistance protein NlpE [Paludibacteraceae bacterium]
MKKNIIYSLILLFTFTACVKNAKNANENSSDADSIGASTEQSHTTPETSKPGWVGDYKGILPCADCEGIETLLSLNEDTTYFLKMDYIGKGQPIVDKGVFTWNADHSKITIQLEDGTQEYLVDKGTLTVLNSEGQTTTGELANDYVLRKQ